MGDLEEARYTIEMTQQSSSLSTGYVNEWPGDEILAGAGTRAGDPAVPRILAGAGKSRGSLFWPGPGPGPGPRSGPANFIPPLTEVI